MFNLFSCSIEQAKQDDRAVAIAAVPGKFPSIATTSWQAEPSADTEHSGLLWSASNKRKEQIVAEATVANFRT